MGEFRRRISQMEAKGNIDRKLEYLPDDDELNDRIIKGLGLTRPEISILISYSKILLQEELINSSITDDKYLVSEINTAFPQILIEQFEDQVCQHRLCREIAATQLCNNLINYMGMTFIPRMKESTGCSALDAVKAFVVTRDVYKLEDLWKQIENLDYKVNTEVQMTMMYELVRLIRRTSRWLLRNRRQGIDVKVEIDYFSQDIAHMQELLPDILHGKPLQQWQVQYQYYRDNNVPKSLASIVAGASSLYSALGIVEAANTANADLHDVVDVYYSLGESLELAWLAQQILELKVNNYWQALVRETLQDDLDWQQRALTVSVLFNAKNTKQTERNIQLWLQKYNALVGRWQVMLGELHATNKGEYSMYAVAIRELLDLAQLSTHSE